MKSSQNEAQSERRMNKSQLAKEFKISRPVVIARLKEAEAPKPDADGLFHVEQCRAYIADVSARKTRGNAAVAGTGIAFQRERKLVLECESLAHELQVAKGEVVAKSEIGAVLLPIISEIHNLMRQAFEYELPSKYGRKTMVQCQEINAEAVDRIIARFKSGASGLVEAKPIEPAEDEA